MAGFPGNSDRIKEERVPELELEDKKIEQVTAEPAIRRKKSLGKKFTSMFFGGDARSAGKYMAFEVLLPAAKDMIAEAGAQGIERLVFGESRRRRGGPPPQAGPTGYVSYNRYSMQNQQQEPPRTISRRARAQHDFDEIVLPTRNEAEEVLDRLIDLVSRYDSATVADLYELVGLSSTHTDHKWGWIDFRGATISRVRGTGYLLDLPNPVPLN